MLLSPQRVVMMSKHEELLTIQITRFVRKIREQEKTFSFKEIIKILRLSSPLFEEKLQDKTILYDEKRVKKLIINVIQKRLTLKSK
jgi:hypothetical protein